MAGRADIGPHCPMVHRPCSTGRAAADSRRIRLRSNGQERETGGASFDQGRRPKGDPVAKRTLCALALVAGIVVPGVDVALAITPRSLPCENETLFLVRAVDPFFPSAVLLFLDPGDTGTGVQSVDSGVLKRSGGNQWVSVGTWDLFSPKEACTLTGLGDVELWLGLRNSDDQGARFDVL